MTLRLYGDFLRHPGMSAVSLSAKGLWVVIADWSDDHQTGGAVPCDVVTALRGTPELIEELIAKELWVRTEGGIRFLDWEYWMSAPEAK